MMPPDWQAKFELSEPPTKYNLHHMIHCFCSHARLEGRGLFEGEGLRPLKAITTAVLKQNSSQDGCEQSVMV